ncbi:MAG TPA: PAS domain S-box protein, partial [Gammaproteobacteria bacterium]|nr:PAS domain S-box protein [Gammaproteobacteria bacterium]
MLADYKKSTIARVFIIYIVLFSSFITLIITVFQIYRDYNSDINIINTELEQIGIVHLNSLSSALWTSNSKLLQTSIEGILEIRDMQYIEIRDDQRIWARAGSIKSKKSIQKRYKMFYSHRDKKIYIGELVVNVSLEGVYQRLYSTVWVMLISNGIKTSLVAIFIYFVFYRLVARHLIAISSFSEEHDPLSNNKELKLDRNNKRQDEFDVVVNSINDMHTRLHDQISEINHQKQYLLQTLDSIGDAVITTDSKGYVIRLNPVAESLTGWKNNMAHKQSLDVVFKIIDSTTREPIENPVDKVLATGETVYLSNHTALISKDGKEYQIADSAAPILSGGETLGMVLVFNDVTEQYKIRQALLESEEKFHTLASVAPVGIFKTDKQGACVYVNEKWCEIAGMSAEEAKDDGWISGLHPDDRQRILAEWRQSISEGVPFKLEYRFKHDDRECWVVGQAVSEKDQNGEVVGCIGTVTDITNRIKAEKALIESEKRLRLIHAQIPGIVFQFKVDRDGNRSLPYVTHAVENHIGLRAKTVMDDVEKWLALTHPDDYPGLKKSMIESKKNMSVWEWEGRFIREDGEQVWLRGTSTPELLEDGSTLWNGIFLNVTKRLLAEEAMRRGQKMDALGKLTGGIAHDYNNMLGVMLGYAELLMEMLGDRPDLLRYVESIKRSGERGAKLTNKLLAFSRHKPSDAGKLSVNKLLLDVKDMLEKTLTARIKLDYSLEDEVWPVYLDESEMEDVILNMSINAMHAIKNNGRLLIETRNEKLNTQQARELGLSSGDYVLLNITDTGAGMDEVTKERIFDPFYSTKGDKGTGLGLSQAYGFVARAGGAIKVDSVLSQGTKFSLYFPVCQIDESSNKRVEYSVEKAQRGKESILVVDDEVDLLNVTCEILSRQ